MGLDTTVEAEPASMRALADYFQQASGRVGGPWGALAGAVVGTGTSTATGELWERANGTEYVIALGYPGYTDRLQGRGDLGPM